MTMLATCRRCGGEIDHPDMYHADDLKPLIDSGALDDLVRARAAVLRVPTPPGRTS